LPADFSERVGESGIRHLFQGNFDMKRFQFLFQKMIQKLGEKSGNFVQADIPVYIQNVEKSRQILTFLLENSIIFMV